MVGLGKLCVGYPGSDPLEVFVFLFCNGLSRNHVQVLFDVVQILFHRQSQLASEQSAHRGYQSEGYEMRAIQLVMLQSQDDE